LTENEQELEAGKFKAVTPIVVPPAVAERFPPHVPVKSLGVATTRPAGKVSLAETFINVTFEFELVNVKVRDVVPFSEMLAAPNPLAIVGGSGGAATVRLAVLLGAPGPVSLAVIGPVVLFSIPKANGAFTFTAIEHAPWAGFAGA
jgi:hypothetical protein